TILLWDSFPQNWKRHNDGRLVEQKHLDELWHNLGDTDPASGYLAMRELISAGKQTTGLLRSRLRPAQKADPEQLATLAKDLDSDEFSVRKAASEELTKLHDEADAALVQALADNISLEKRRRIKLLRKQLALYPVSGE